MNEQLLENFSKKLNGGGVFGPFIQSTEPALAEAAGWAGFDFVIIDMEHGPVTLENAQNFVRAAQVAGTLPIIRVPNLSEVEICHALDIGAAGVQVPQITTAAEAEITVKAAKYYPQGMRGVCPFVRAAHYSTLPMDKYFALANKALVIVQLEGKEAIENMDAIFSVPGIDIVFIGPFDLSQSLGIPGNVTHPTVVAEMEKIVAKAKEKNIAVGSFTVTRDAAKVWKKAGVQYLSYFTDLGIYREACSDLCNFYKGL
jgi:4-hydroxy-2-oxoheptanedioate aldolase